MKKAILKQTVRFRRLWQPLVLAVFGLAFMPVSAYASTLAVSPSTGTFNQGCNFSINVLLDTQGVVTDGTDAIILYDPTRLTANPPIVNGTIYQDYPGSNIDAQNGKITISGIASVSQGFTGSGILATVNFTVASAGTAAALTFDFDPNNKSKTTDSNVVERGTIIDTLSSVTNGNYTLGTGTCASQTATPGNPGGGAAPQGAVSTPSATTPPNKLPSAGSETLTYTVAIVGSALTILGVLGLALL